ncbi:SDR family oxidoreductase [Streptosporangium sp. NBC_01755]|uniref:SDR family NAD(P)-dependent oxidoreductase n=1 Tax=unclassified Streptosporangium TaxID=2632669 RepID=UPI002DDA6804|nr:MULTISPECIES: SDR family oxidoreductase [unclassified Streptosporangium]WSA25607.1 SDR family oxidoreductase [Streptosporangium sp. NBC_01810]WSD03005.1 SDR family oxidoreductase [Streptosporangium sp. NBC_01755]
MSHPLSDRTAVVTGAGGGLGRAVARALSRSGARVACGDLDGQAARETAHGIVSDGGTAMSWQVDVTDEAAVQGWRDEITTRLGAASIIVNVAGTIDRRLLLDLDHDAFLRAVDVNLGGPYAVIRAFARDLLDRGSGRIVNVASVAGTTGYPFPSYAASKAGLVNLTRSLLTDFWGTGITVNAVCPGAMDTPMFNTALIPEMARRSPIGRIVTVDEVAAAVEFLCQDAAAGVNGVALTVDGGATAVIKYFDNE